MAHASKEIFSSADCRRRLGHRGRRLRPKDADTTSLIPSPPQRSAQEAGSGSAPKLLDIDYLGRLRAEFYNKSSEWRRTSSSPRMPYVSEVTVKVRAQDLKPVEKKRGKEREHTHRHHSHRRKKERVDGGSDDERADVDKVHTSGRPEGGGEGSSSAKRESEGDGRSSARDRKSSRHKDERRKRGEGIRERVSQVDGTKGYDRDHGSLRQPSSRSVRLRESSVRPKDSSMAASDLSRLTRSTSVREPPSSTSQLPLGRSNTTTSRARSSSRRPTSAMPSSVTGDVKVKDRSGGRDGRDHKNSSLLAALFGFQTPPRVPEKIVECVACMGDYPASKAAKLPCNHIMCHDCLSRIFTLSVTDPQHMPPKCCTQDHIPLKHVDRLFSDKFKHQWNQKYQEFTTKNRIYCPTKGCGEWIKPANIHTDTSGGPGGGRKHGKCSRCKTKVCCLCNGKWHVEKDCPKDEDTKKFVEIAKKAGWQRCYNCSAMVELKEGCNHMTCRCKAEFCMICATKWKSCDCPLFSYDQVNIDPIPFVIPPFRVAGRNRRQPFGQPLDHNEGLERRREQERADEELARRLQTIDLANLDLADGRFGVRDENFARIAAEIAAGGEALNQAMRNHIRPAQRQQRDRNIGVPGNRQQFAPPPPLPRAPSPPPFPPIDPYRHPSPQPTYHHPHPHPRPRIPTNPTFDPPPPSYHSDYHEPVPRGHAAAPPLRPTLRRRGDAAYEFGGSDGGDVDDEFVGRVRRRGGWEEDEGEGYGYLLDEDRRRTRRVGAWLDEVPDEDVLVDTSL